MSPQSPLPSRFRSRPGLPARRLPPWWSHALALVAAVGLQASAQSDRVVLAPAEGFSLVWDGNNGGFSSPEPGATAPENAALSGNGAVAFGSSAFQPGGIHDFPNVNDGFYGNSSSWIPDFAANPPDATPYIAVAFGRSVNVASVAWSRDNGDASEPSCGGTCVDRVLGVYTLQVTRVPSPDGATSETGDASTGWQTIGTVEYRPGADTAAFRAHLRHRFDVSQGGAPIAATGLRIRVPDANTCIDEIEVNPPADPIPPISNFITWTNAPGFALTWDLNDGALYNPASPAPAPVNRARASQGTRAFGSSELGLGTHFITNVNDGLYGNAHSWIPNAGAPDADPYIGLDFGGSVDVRRVAWGRDNGDDAGDCCGGELTDRALGLYVLQVTQVANPGVATAETGDAATGWATVAWVHYRSAGAVFTPHRRHRFEIGTAAGGPVRATGLRLKVPNASTAIDELEVNTFPALEQDLGDSLVLTPESGYALAWDGNDGLFQDAQAGARSPAHAGLASSGAVAFGSSELGYGIHFISKINDGVYGNSSSWISANGLGGTDDPDPFIGIRLPGTIELSSIAWGRDNGDTTEGGCGGTCLDRSLGVYTLQVTRVNAPGIDTPETGDAASGWETVGTVEYRAAVPPGFNPSLRHAFEVSRNGAPIPVTGVRVKVSSGSLALDELEINPGAGASVPNLEDLLAITPSGAFAILWDRNEGEFSSPDAQAPARDNAALASRGSAAFGSGELDLGVHFIRNINDGIYGNAHSWIPNPADPAAGAPFVGVRLPGPTWVRSVAFGRDNGDATDCCGGTLTDRALGTYTLQITRVSSPDAGTPETGNAATGWVTVGTLAYKAAAPNVFTPHLRHRFEVLENGSSVLATGIRLKVSSDQLAIDEIEVNPTPSPDQNVLLIAPFEGYTVFWDGNNGDYGTTNSPAPAPDNEALASRGATAFGSSQLDLAVHFIANVNDGQYGNSRSWIADFINGDAAPWVGVRFGRSVAVRSVAWGRDNGDVADCCGGTLTDRAAGTYLLEYTQVSAPDVATEVTDDPTTGWAAIARFEYRGGGTAAFRHHLRHEYAVARNGAPIEATALRLIVSNSQMAIDELEVNPVPRLPEVGSPPTLSIGRTEAGLRIQWEGPGTLQSRDTVGQGTWADVEGTSPFILTPSGAARFYRVRR